jgi:hypothetical protein
MVTKPGFMRSVWFSPVEETVTLSITLPGCALQVKRMGKMEQRKAWLSQRRSIPKGDIFEHLASTETEPSPFADIWGSPGTRETNGLFGSQANSAMELPAWVKVNSLSFQKALRLTGDLEWFTVKSTCVPSGLRKARDSRSSNPVTPEPIRYASGFTTLES